MVQAALRQSQRQALINQVKDPKFAELVTQVSKRCKTRQCRPAGSWLGLS